MNRSVFLFLAVVLMSAIGYAQPLPSARYDSPMKQDVALSATFAEFRSNHFHGGLDMRTGGAIGVPVYAVDDGYVSRISISPWGGGKVLYVRHPNGLTSVYMHLNDYAGSIGTFVRERQYNLHSYTLSENLEEGQIVVRRGQLIAHSGNTGGSAGPHLHFEMRHEASGRAFNPMLFGIPFRDAIPPTIRGIRIYPSNELSTVDGRNEVCLLKADSVRVSGGCYIGIYATDAAEGSTLKNGFDSLSVEVDDQPYFCYSSRLVPIDSSRMVNALIDYPYFVQTREAYLLTRGLPGAEGPWVPLRRANGCFEFRVGSRHIVKVSVFDFKGNKAEKSFTIIAEAPSSRALNAEVEEGVEVLYDRPFVWMRNGMRVKMDPYTLYDNDRLRIYAIAMEGGQGNQYVVEPMKNAIPPHQSYELALPAASDITVVPDKVVVAKVDGNRTTAYSTQFVDGRYVAKVRDFGRFALLPDTEPPLVQPSNFKPGVRLKSYQLKVKIADNLSGIDSYHCYINGSWVLAEYDAKSNMLIISATRFLKAGNNELQVDVRDMCGNLTRKKYTLVK